MCTTHGAKYKCGHTRVIFTTTCDGVKANKKKSCTKTGKEQQVWKEVNDLKCRDCRAKALKATEGLPEGVMDD
jgi:hypothetical protein